MTTKVKRLMSNGSYRHIIDNEANKIIEAANNGTRMISGLIKGGIVLIESDTVEMVDGEDTRVIIFKIESEV